MIGKRDIVKSDIPSPAKRWDAHSEICFSLSKFCQGDVPVQIPCNKVI